MKVGRNENCPCGSGVKYKKCCLLNPHNIPISFDEKVSQLRDMHSRLADLKSLKMEKIYNQNPIFFDRSSAVPNTDLRIYILNKEKYPQQDGEKILVNNLGEYIGFYQIARMNECDRKDFDKAVRIKYIQIKESFRKKGYASTLIMYLYKGYQDSTMGKIISNHEGENIYVRNAMKKAGMIESNNINVFNEPILLSPDILNIKIINTPTIDQYFAEDKMALKNYEIIKS